jgi:tetratricopeptide (TPR) repeat protein
MRYDRHGFPVPPEFEGADPAHRESRSEPDGTTAAAASSTAARGRWGRKQLAVAAIMIGVVLPVALSPLVQPLVRDTVVLWMLKRAAVHEVHDRPGAAAAALGVALGWQADDIDLLCLRAALRLEDRDAAGAIADASRALSLAPTNPRPARVRALANVVRGDADAALADAELVLGLSAPRDPDALNHRAYIRALVGRDLPAALADVDDALAGTGGTEPELLDTRGYVLHLLGRQQEAVDQLNLAIDGMQQRRRDLALLAGRVDRIELARRLRWLDHALAVMLHHRGLACRALGLDGQAEQDLSAAEKKGFDPGRGIL